MTQTQEPQDVDLLVTGAEIVTLDKENRVIRDGAIAVDGNRIVWMGPTNEAGRYKGKAVINGNGRIILPGLIDAHFHTGQQLLRGKLQDIARGRPLKLPVWKNYLIPWESCLDPEDVYLSGLVAYSNMLQVGTTCFAEAGGPHPDEMGRAAMDVGIRGFIALSTVDQSETIGAEVPANMLMSHDEALERNVALVERWKGNDRVSAWLSLRQVIVCSPDLIRDIAEASRTLDVKIHTHLCEGSYEIDYTLEKFGKRPTEWLDQMGVLSHHLHCAHSVLLSPGRWTSTNGTGFQPAIAASTIIRSARPASSKCGAVASTSASAPTARARAARSTSFRSPMWPASASKLSTAPSITNASRFRPKNYSRSAPRVAHGPSAFSIRSVVWKWARRPTSSSATPP